MPKTLKDRAIHSRSSLLEAFKMMDALGKKLLLVLDNNVFIGLISAGDIQRAIIANKPLHTEVKDILRADIKIAKPSDSIETIKKMMFDYRMEFCPVVNSNNEILKVFFWEDLFYQKEKTPRNQFNLPVVIMAGGMGSRLKPLTNVIPKPLIPIGEKTMLEEIFERFALYGCNQFHISVNYKADLIEYYINNLKLPYSINYFRENKPLGTAGSLHLLKGQINSTFIVTNCDILIEQDYSEILQYHYENKNEITIIAALKHYPIPYGTIKSGENGKLLSLTEKPELTFKINSGMYILEPHLIAEIPNNSHFHITDLIEDVKRRNGNIGVFPVSQHSWKDIGEWNEYIDSIIPNK
jgi:dTDP-glucose pyrophosphorylase